MPVFPDTIRCLVLWFLLQRVSNDFSTLRRTPQSMILSVLIYQKVLSESGNLVPLLPALLVAASSIADSLQPDMIPLSHPLPISASGPREWYQVLNFLIVTVSASISSGI